MLEYIFFHKPLLERFLQQLEQHSVPCETRDDAMGLVAAVPEDLDDALLEQVDEIYEALLNDTEKLLDADTQYPAIAIGSFVHQRGAVRQFVVGFDNSSADR